MAVSSYRFIIMYVLIGLLVGGITAMSMDFNSGQKGMKLNKAGLEGYTNLIDEIGTTNEELLESSETLIQADTLKIGNTFGDETNQGRNWIQILRNGFLPYGFLPGDNDDYTDMERGLNTLLIWFRVIILMLAGFEIFLIIFNKKPGN